MKVLVGLLAAAMGLGGCASMQRLTSYSDGNLTADAQVWVQGRPMNVSMHPRDQTMLAQMTVADSATAGMIRGATFGLAGGFKPDPREVDRALTRFVGPTGCAVTPVQEIGHDSISFEAAYSCPAGVDLRAIVKAQHAALMRREPIRMP